MWELVRDVILFVWADYCATRALEFMGIVTTATLRDQDGNRKEDVSLLRIYESVDDPTYDAVRTSRKESLLDICNILLNYDRLKQAEEFAVSDYSCGICLSQHKGSDCFRFNSCRHVYCRECLKSYYTLLIKEGDVDAVGCPNEVCKKERVKLLEDTDSRYSQATSLDVVDDLMPIPQAEMLQILGNDQTLFSRYLEFVKKKMLDNRTDVAYCPRPDCEAPTLVKNKDDKLVICSKCSFSYCFICGSVWHGYSKYGCTFLSSNLQMAYLHGAIAREYD